MAKQCTDMGLPLCTWSRVLCLYSVGQNGCPCHCQILMKCLDFIDMLFVFSVLFLVAIYTQLGAGCEAELILFQFLVSLDCYVLS